jgi:hypothetical protein
MLTTLWDTLREWFLWCLEGLYGSLVAATRFHTDVPWVQCLLGTLAFVAPVVLLDLLLFDKLRRKRRLKRIQKDQSFED